MLLSGAEIFIDVALYVGLALFNGMLIGWQSVGIWRSANRYKKTKKFWGSLAQFFVVASIVVTLATFAQSASEIAALINPTLSDKRAGMEALPPATTVVTNIDSGADEHGNHY